MLQIEELLDLNHTIARDIFNDNDMIKVIKELKMFIINLGISLDDNYTKVGEDIWISKSAKVDASATIIGPCIIDHNTEIRKNAFIRGSVIVGKNCVIGNSCELKNALIFDNCQIPHFNYIGDSIMGYHSHIGAGVIVTNLKSDKSNVVIKGKDFRIETGLRKMGTIIGNYVEVGCNSTMFPGTVIYPNTIIYPLTRVRGIIPKNSIVKDENSIVERRNINE